MHILLDTHVALWAVAEPERLSATAHAVLSDSRNTFYVSVVSIWEIAIKRALGRKGQGAIYMSAREAMDAFMAADMIVLDILAEHALAVEALPSLHRDPFDRMIVAQSLSEPLRLMTHDRRVAAYADTAILV
jgi:PIN domain nuclease of toxin-antitoxin system